MIALQSFEVKIGKQSTKVLVGKTIPPMILSVLDTEDMKKKGVIGEEITVAKTEKKAEKTTKEDK